jgi:lipoate-protein ligase B
MTGRLRDLGRLDYATARGLQCEVADSVREGEPDTLLLVEHDPVLTLGANFHQENLLFPEERYAQLGIAIERTDRGGDVTYHGPGQLVAYPIFDLNRHGRDLHRWMRDLEETLIVALRHWNLEGRRFPPHTGAWIGEAKVAAIGVKVRRWVSEHGIALNCDLDLAPFDTIVPCGIQGRPVTSLSRAAGRTVTVEEAKAPLVAAFAQVFDIAFPPPSM